MAAGLLIAVAIWDVVLVRFGLLLLALSFFINLFFGFVPMAATIPHVSSLIMCECIVLSPAWIRISKGAGWTSIRVW